MTARPLHEIPKGSVLAEPILDGDGRILLRAGTVLTDAVLGVLARLHVSQVDALDADVTDDRSTPTRGDGTGESGTNRATPEFPRTDGWQDLFADHKGSHEMGILEAGLTGWAAARRARRQRAEADA
ncbi:MAG: hypothetical protein AB7O52_04930 [Planctomycetota bacterium]